MLIAGWVGIYIGLAHRWWPAVGLVGTAAILWLLWLEWGTDPRRPIYLAILRTAFWVMVSLLAFLTLVFFLLLIATVGAELGLWGSPWDDR